MTRESRPDRRTFLGATTATLLTGAAAGGADPTADRDGALIVRMREPENLETPFETLDGFLTATDRFYVRNHFPGPVLAADTWKLDIAGAVQKPVQLTYDDLLKLPSRTAAVTLECAGNGRSLLEQ